MHGIMSIREESRKGATMRNSELTKRMTAKVEKPDTAEKKARPGLYYVLETPVRGEPIKHLYVDVQVDGVTRKKAINQEEGKKLCDDGQPADSHFELIRASDGVLLHRREADYSAYISKTGIHVKVSETAIVAADEGGEILTAVVEKKKSKKRPDTYVISVENMPATLAKIKGTKSCAMLVVSKEPGSTTGQVVFDTWSRAYFFCVDIKSALKDMGYSSRGNYNEAIWRHSMHDHPTVIVTFVSHLEKVTAPDRKED